MIPNKPAGGRAATNETGQQPISPATQPKQSTQEARSGQAPFGSMCSAIRTGANHHWQPGRAITRGTHRLGEGPDCARKLDALLESSLYAVLPVPELRQNPAMRVRVDSDLDHDG